MLYICLPSRKFSNKKKRYMFKFLILLLLRALSGNFICVSIAWLFGSIVVLCSGELIQRSLHMVGVSKAIVVLTFWVGGIILYASVSSFINRKARWLLTCVFFLNFFLVCALRSKTLLRFYFFFERTLVPTLFLVLG